MDGRWRNSRRVPGWLVPGGLASLLALLAWLQWRWLDELAATRREEQGRFVRASVERVARDLDDAVAEVARAGDAAELSAPLAELVVDRLPLRRGADGTLELADGAAAGAAEGARIATALAARAWPDPPRVPVEPPVPLPELPAVVTPARDALIRLDADRLFGTFLAERLRSHCGSELAADLRAGVLAGDRLVRSSEPDLVAADLEPADAEAALFALVRLDGMFLGGDGPPSEVRWVEETLAGDPSTVPRWRLVVRHRAGSIDAAIAASRRANLALAGGLLALLAAGGIWTVRAQARARRLAEQEVAFLAGVSHELRTPLAVLRTAASNLRRGVVADPGRVAEYGALLEREAKRLGALVDGVLRLTRGGEVSDAAPEELEARALVEEASAGLEAWRDERRFRLAVEIEPPDARLVGDRAGLVSALSNLLDNAVKHGPDGGTVRVSVAVADGVATIAVADDGPGIPPAERGRAFEAFWRGAAARERGTPGSGLGLSVVRRVVDRHGGRATAEDGAVVLRLPVNGAGGGA